MKKVAIALHTEMEMTHAAAERHQSTVEVDPFYREENQQLLMRRIVEYKVSPETFKEHELIEID